MLQSIRDKTQGVITWTIIGVICVTFAMWGVGNYFVSAGADKPIAEINGEKISLRTFAQAYKNMLQQQAAGDRRFAALNEQQLKAETLHQLIQQKILTQSAGKQGFHINDDEIYTVLNQIPDLQVDGKFSTQRLQQLLGAIGLSQQQFFQTLRERLLIGQVQDGLIDSSFVLPAEAKRYAHLFNQTRDFGYLVIPYSDFTAGINAATITDDVIKTYYDTHQREFMLPPQVQLEYIQLSQKQIEQTFAKKDKATAKAKAANAFMEETDKLANLSYENPETLDVVASELDLPVKTTQFFTPAGSSESEVTRNADVLKTAFSPEVFHDGYNSDVINIDPKTLVVIRAKSSKAGRVAALTDVKDKIIKALKIQAAKKRAIEVGQQLASDAEKNHNLETVAQKHAYSYYQKNGVKRSADNVNSQILQTVFAMPKLASNQQQYKFIQLTNGRVVVVGLTAIHPDKAVVSEKAMNVVHEQLASDFGKIDYAMYRQAMFSQAKIKQNHKLMAKGETDD